ncbi:MAG: ATP-grasp domain-containing protein [Desulfurivibrionaceae bacterium]|jgi:carbamoyl-phosphate synthase large subunit
MKKNKPVILVTGVCGDIGSSAVYALNDFPSVLIGTDVQQITPVRGKLGAFYTIPGAQNVDQYIQSMLEIVERKKVLFLLPISEPEIVVISAHRAIFERLGVRLLINNEMVVENFLDKLKTSRFLEKLGVEVPKSVSLAEFDGNWDFPVIVKSKRGCGSKRLWVAEREDIDYLRRKDEGDLIVQELVGSAEEEFTTGVFSDGDRVSSITFRRKLGYGGLSKEVVLADVPYLAELSRKIARAVKLVGAINIQSRKHGGNYLPFEINPRLSSTLLFRKKFGFDDVVWWVKVLSGESYSYQPIYRAGKALRCCAEYYYDLESV